MNLRITPNFNTQNNKQNVNFGMIKCSSKVSHMLRDIVHAAGGNLDVPVAMHILSSDKFSATKCFLAGNFQIPQKDIEKLVEDFPHTYMMGGERVEFNDFRILANAAQPLAKARELAAAAIEITEDSVAKFVSMFGVKAKEAELRAANCSVLDALGIKMQG